MAAIAVAVGVRAESCTTAVPSLIRSVWAAIQASGVKASEPHDSAVQTESNPTARPHGSARRCCRAAAPSSSPTRDPAS